jgi:hypothetical protein
MITSRLLARRSRGFTPRHAQVVYPLLDAAARLSGTLPEGTPAVTYFDDKLYRTRQVLWQRIEEPFYVELNIHAKRVI